MVSNRVVCEIGPGWCALTWFLLAACASKIVLVEVDFELLPRYVLMAKACPGHLDLVLRDAMRFRYSGFVFGSRLSLLFVSGLPYNVASRLLVLMAQARCRMLLILQKELCYKAVASYSSLKLFFMNFSVEKLFSVASSKFCPKPKTNSVCVVMTPVCCGMAKAVSFVNVLWRFDCLR
ncbi:MAG: rRNA adenine N-6-methyltransferase family protein [Candidatus Hodgkinia cicadicola]|nr:MAG: rRNA adenine N-6-methyltransferase family protein [Candidatus Hodgkinia cicadicola]